MNTNPIRTTDIKRHNIMSVLSMIYEERVNGGISQSEVVNRIGLKAPSVFRIFSYLEENEFICQCQNQMEVESKKGRHPVYFTVCPDALYVFSVEFWASSISLGVFNFNGDKIYTKFVNLSSDVNVDDVTSAIYSMTEEAIKNLNIPRNKIAGIGVAAPGKVHVEDGVIVFYPRINGMVNYPIKSILESKLKLNVVVHNNCSVITSSVYHHTSIDCGDAMFAYLIRGGVNGALVTKDGIFTSSDGTTLEAGHIPVDVNGPECSCGLNGCLQAFLYQLDNEYTGKPFLSHDIFESIKNINVEKSKNIICKAAYYMFSSMKLIQRSFSPQSFLIICPSLTLAESIAFEIRKLYEISVDHFQSVKPKVFAVAYDNDLALIGASDLVLNQYFRQG